MTRRDVTLRVGLCVLALACAGWTLLGGNGDVLGLVPVLLVTFPLLVGRYVGEDALARLAGRSSAASVRRAPPVVEPQSFVRVMQRGGRLVASAMAKRPPPAALSPLAA